MSDPAIEQALSLADLSQPEMQRFSELLAATLEQLKPIILRDALEQHRKSDPVLLCLTRRSSCGTAAEAEAAMRTSFDQLVAQFHEQIGRAADAVHVEVSIELLKGDAHGG
jgi:hypothetical protein